MRHLSLVPKESEDQIRPRLSVPRTEIDAYQRMATSVVGQEPMVPASGASSAMWVALAFAVAFGMCVWVIAVCQDLARLAH